MLAYTRPGGHRAEPGAPHTTAAHSPPHPTPASQDLSGSHAAVTEERDALSQQQAGHLARIRTLEEDVQAISAKVLQKEVELDR